MSAFVCCVEQTLVAECLLLVQSEEQQMYVSCYCV